ncbi:MAG: response regulator [Chloroflexi bacterium]|nr:response regulator [Chloroflexota bacterium]MDL1884377.1 response regulator [Anaerolineae bacterium CFX8]
MQTILIVDDEPAFLDILDMILRRAGYNILAASDGVQALQIVRAYPVDLLLIDDMLPNMSGGEVCATLKHDPAFSHLPVILFSAGARVRDQEFIRRIGADGALLKPFRPEEVIRVVQNCLGAPV